MIGFKRRVNVIMSLLLSMVFMFLLTTGGVFVKAEEIDEITAEEESLTLAYIGDVQNELSEDGVTVEYVLMDFIDRMEHSDIDECHEMGEAAEQMLQEYNEVFNPGLSSDWISIGSRFRRNYITRAAVAVATAYFLYKQYYLSAELLMRARTNALWGMTYIPISFGVVTRTALFKDIGANEEWDNETSAQFKGGTLAEDDAHYAINWFNFTTERTLGGTLIHITDVYDFDFDFGDAYTGVVGFGANVMAIAQRVGVLTPYNVKIDQWYYGDMYI